MVRNADPSDPRGGLVKIKPWDYGLRAALTKDCGKHWRIGAIANVGQRDMLYQYPDVGIKIPAAFVRSLHKHQLKICRGGSSQRLHQLC